MTPDRHEFSERETVAEIVRQSEQASRELRLFTVFVLLVGFIVAVLWVAEPIVSWVRWIA